MKYSDFLSAGLFHLTALAAFGATPKTDKPNIIFFMAEDLSQRSFELYQGEGARTPHLDAMASHGVVFNNAYSCAPVSSAARTTLITGCYAPSYGLSSHRKLRPIELPEDMRLFPAYLKDAGYYTVNAAKTDYNCVMQYDAWDVVDGKIGDWRKCKETDQPFFYCLTVGACHESSLHFPASDTASIKTIYNPDKVRVYDYHPDTKLFRYTYSRLYDKIEYVDGVLGKMISMLEQDGLLANTFIFYMGDNGGSHPFTKGYTNEAGLNVPFVVYIPDNWKNHVSFEFGERTSGFISFMDVAPTVLRLAGLVVPEYMDGTPFFGADITKDMLESRDEVYCYGDRYDELYAVNRTVRKGNLKYSRNFYPFQPKGMYCAYRYLQAAFREWKSLYEKGELTAIQGAFFEPQGVEELYDLSKDPFETVNLAGNPEYARSLGYMRQLLECNMKDKKDLAVIPEAFWLEGADDIMDYRTKISAKYSDYFNAAQLQIQPINLIKEELIRLLNSEDPIMRYWAVTACCHFGEDVESLASLLVRMLSQQEFSIIRSKVAMYCIRNGVDISRDIFREILAEAENEAAVLMILNDIAVLYDTDKDFIVEITEEDLPFYPTAYNDRLDYFRSMNEIRRVKTIRNK